MADQMILHYAYWGTCGIEANGQGALDGTTGFVVLASTSDSGRAPYQWLDEQSAGRWRHRSSDCKCQACCV